MPVNKIPNRVAVSTRDICNIIGTRPKASRLLLSRLRESLGKEPHQVVTVKELCQYLAVPEDDLAEFFRT